MTCLFNDVIHLGLIHHISAPGCSRWKRRWRPSWYWHTASHCNICMVSCSRALITLRAASGDLEALNWFQRHHALQDGDIHMSRGWYLIKYSQSLRLPSSLERSPWFNPNEQLSNLWDLFLVMWCLWDQRYFDISLKTGFSRIGRSNELSLKKFILPFEADSAMYFKRWLKPSQDCLSSWIEWSHCWHAGLFCCSPRCCSRLTTMVRAPSMLFMRSCMFCSTWFMWFTIWSIRTDWWKAIWTSDYSDSLGLSSPNRWMGACHCPVKVPDASCLKLWLWLGFSFGNWNLHRLLHALDTCWGSEETPDVLPLLTLPTGRWTKCSTGVRCAPEYETSCHNGSCRNESSAPGALSWSTRVPSRSWPAPSSLVGIDLVSTRQDLSHTGTDEWQHESDAWDTTATHWFDGVTWSILLSQLWLKPDHSRCQSYGYGSNGFGGIQQWSNTISDQDILTIRCNQAAGLHCKLGYLDKFRHNVKIEFPICDAKRHSAMDFFEKHSIMAFGIFDST